MTIQRLALAAAVSVSLCAGAAQAGDLVQADRLPAKINQDRFDLGFVFVVAKGEWRSIVPPTGPGPGAADAILCNISEAEGGYAINGMKHRIAAKSCLPLYGIKSLDVVTDDTPGWTGAVLVRPHKD